MRQESGGASRTPTVKTTMDGDQACCAHLTLTPGGPVVPCPGRANRDAPLPLCDEHLLLAGDWVAREFGVTDLLAQPCVACGSPLGIRYPSGWICAVCEWRVGESPADDLPNVRVDVVYYIRYADRVKIGTSANPRQRIGALPHHEVLAFERGGRVLESKRHVQFGEHRIPGTEWFESNPALTQHIEALRAGVEDPWALYARWRSAAVALRG